MLWTRIATAAVGIPLALVVIWLGGWALTVAIALLAVLGLREYRRMFGQADAIDVWGDGVLAVGAIFWASRDPAYGYCESAAVWAGAGLLLTVLFHRFWTRRFEPSLLRSLLESQFLRVPYVAALFGYVLLLRNFVPGTVRHTPVPLGAAILFLAIGACWATDAAAYLVGRKIGRHKLAPKISPGKTVEGAAAGLLGAAIFVGAVGTWLAMGPWSAALLGLTLGVVSQAGDLFESWLKRRAGVKDSGALLPGHGGVLDRFDSLLFVAPVTYYWLLLWLALRR